MWILFCIYIQTVQYEVWPHLMWCSHLCVHRLLKLLDLLLTNCSPYFWMSTVCSCAMVAGCDCPLMKPLTQRVPRPVRRHVGTRFFSKEVSPHPERLALLHCPHCTTILYSFRLDVLVPQKWHKYQLEQLISVCLRFTPRTMRLESLQGQFWTYSRIQHANSSTLVIFTQSWH